MIGRGTEEAVVCERISELSAAQTAAIADAATLAPEAEARLVAEAADRSLAELLEACAVTKATATDPEERRRAIHATRSLRAWGDAEGAGHLHLRDNPEVVAEVMAAVARWPTACSTRPGGRAAGSRPRPTGPTPSSRWCATRRRAPRRPSPGH